MFKEIDSAGKRSLLDHYVAWHLDLPRKARSSNNTMRDEFSDLCILLYLCLLFYGQLQDTVIVVDTNIDGSQSLPS